MDTQADADVAVYISPVLYHRGDWRWADLAGPVAVALIQAGWDKRTAARVANRLHGSGPAEGRAIAMEFADVYVGYRPGDRTLLTEAERSDRAQQ